MAFLGEVMNPGLLLLSAKEHFSVGSCVFFSVFHEFYGFFRTIIPFSVIHLIFFLQFDQKPSHD